MARRRNPATIVIAPHEYPSATAYGTSYGAFVRGIAHDLKSGDATAVRYAAAAMAPLLPPGATLVPVPSSRGDTSANRRLAEAIARLAHARVDDGLGREPGESQYARRKRGVSPLAASEQRVEWTGGRLRDPVVLIDNVVTSGATATSAERAIGRTAAILVWADARRR